MSGKTRKNIDSNTAKMLAAKASKKSERDCKHQTTWTTILSKGVLLIFMALVIGMRFRATARLDKQNIYTYRCTNLYAQETMGSWQITRSVTANFSQRGQTILHSSEPLPLMVTLTSTQFVQVRARGKAERRDRESQALPPDAEANQAKVHIKSVTSRVCILVKHIRSKRGNLINSPTCEYLLNRKAQ